MWSDLCFKDMTLATTEQELNDWKQTQRDKLGGCCNGPEVSVWGLNQGNGGVDSENEKDREAKKEIETRLGEWLDVW